MDEEIDAHPDAIKLNWKTKLILLYFIVSVSGWRSVHDGNSLSVFLAFSMLYTFTFIVAFKMWNEVVKLGIR